MNCIVELCDRAAKKKGLCLSHYQRFARNGENFNRSPIVNVSCMISKFISKIGSINDNGCMEWLGWKNKFGYGKFSVGSKYIFAHRYSYEYYIGAITDDMCVCHTCDNPSCVNPAHLWLGTNTDNRQDMVNKNRQPYKKGVAPKIDNKGSKHVFAKLNENKVRDIKVRLSQGVKGTVLAREYNVVYQTIYEIKNGKNWKHVQ